MTTFKLLGLLILALTSFNSYSFDSKSWDTVLLENRDKLDLYNSFVAFDEDFYYLGIKSLEPDSLDAELEFLLTFQDYISAILANLCAESQSSLRESYNFNFSFSKNVVEEIYGSVFIAAVGKQVLMKETKHACTASAL